MDDYLQSLEVTKVRTLDELMQFMRDNAEQELPAESPNLTRLETAAKCDMSDDQYRDALLQLRAWGQKRAVDQCLEDFGVDVIIGPADSRIHELSTAAGYPIATLPLSYADFNGRPFGLAAVTSAYQEGVMIHLMSAWERVFNQQRRIPTWLTGDS
jgi:amidase